MGENSKFNEKCIKGNTSYYKIKVDDMVNYEITKFSVNEELYKKLESKVTEKFAKFSNDLLEGKDFNAAITKLRDEVIYECVELDKSSSSVMRPFFKDYIFDKIYTMGINIKKGLLPEDYEQQLEEEKQKLEEEAKQKEEEEKENTNNITITVENESEEKDPDLVDLIWSYFFGGSKSSSSKTEKKVEPEKEEQEPEEKKVKV